MENKIVLDPEKEYGIQGRELQALSQWFRKIKGLCFDDVLEPIQLLENVAKRESMKGVKDGSKKTA